MKSAEGPLQSHWAADAPALSLDLWLDALDEPAWLVEASQCRVVQVNAAAAAWLDAAPQSFIGRAAEELLPSLEDAAFWAERRAGYPGDRLTSNLDLPRPGGLAAQYRRRIVPLGAPPQAYLVSLQDRSADQRAELERESLLAELRSTLEATADGILVVDLSGKIRAFNRRFAALWHLPEAALTGQSDADLLAWMRQSVLHPHGYEQRLQDIAGQLLLAATDRVQLLNGTLLERHTQPQWSAGRPIGRVYSFRPVTRQRNVEPEPELPLEAAAPIAWPHRASFVEQLDRAVERARVLSRPLALLCVEFDREALFGSAGRSAARTAAELAEGLRACVREQHILAHLGAARFALLLSHATEEGAEKLAQRLQSLAGQHGQGLLATFGLGLHIGIAVYPESGASGDELLTHAEQALLQSTAQGVPGWKFHERAAPMPIEGRRQQRLEKVVRAGLPGLTFRLHFQPRFDARDGTIQAMEALLRWHDVEDGLLLPGQFLPLAARLDVLEALDSWALEHALRQAGLWLREGWRPRLTVNVSGASLSQPAYARRIAALLESTAWPPEALELDLAESAVNRDPEAALYNMQTLRRMGVHLNLDDWGQGESALSLLRRFPWSAVKIDRSLVRAVPGARVESGVFRALVQMAQAIGQQVYAEGVEYAPQQAFIAECGCAGWQGLLGAAALEPRACERLLRARVGSGAEASPPGTI